MFLIDNCNFDINNINGLSMTDFDLYYSKKIQKINEERQKVNDAKNKPNVLSFM